MSLLIKDISKDIKATYSDADKYIDKAIKYKDSEPKLAQVYYEISQDHMREINELHDCVVTIIEQYRKAKGEPPEVMLALYDYEHEMIMEEVAEVKIKTEMYKSM